MITFGAGAICIYLNSCHTRTETQTETANMHFCVPPQAPSIDSFHKGFWRCSFANSGCATHWTKKGMESAICQQQPSAPPCLDVLATAGFSSLACSANGWIPNSCRTVTQQPILPCHHIFLLQPAKRSHPPSANEITRLSFCIPTKDSKSSWVPLPCPFPGPLACRPLRALTAPEPQSCA